METYILMGICLVCFIGTIGLFRLLIADRLVQFNGLDPKCGSEHVRHKLPVRRSGAIAVRAQRLFSTRPLSMCFSFCR